MGDFNLDASMSVRPDYNYKIPMKNLSEFALESNLTQLVTFNTWSRTIKGVIKESVLDHVYVNNFASVLNVTFSVPVFGDHVLVLVELNVKCSVNNDTFQKRDWTSYSPIDMNNTLLSNLNIASTDWSSLDVQASWNAIENIIINTVDKLAPIKIFPVDQPLKVKNLPFSIKNKINKRNRLLKKRDDTSHLPQLKSLSKEIKEFFCSKKISKVKKASLGPKTNIWRAVKAAKDLSSVGLPTNLTLGGVPVLRGTFANTFATHFNSKVVTNTR